MSAPLAQTTARNIGNQLASGFREGRDENAISRIISEAVDSGDPKILQNSIGQILSQVSPERQPAAIKYLEAQYKSVVDKKQAEKDELEARTAATEAGVTYGLPPAVQAAQIRAKAPQKPAGGVTGQPIPQDISQKIANVVRENPNLTSDELAIKLDEAQIPPIYSNKYIENRRRQDEARINQQIKSGEISRNEQLAFHKESQVYDDSLREQDKIAKKQIESVNSIEKAVKSGKVKPSSFANIFKGLGKIGDKLSEALINENEAVLLGSIPQLLEGWKEVFGVRLSDADLKVLQDKLPSIGKNPEANLAILNILKKYADMTLLRSKISKDIKKEYNDLRPLGYADKVEERFEESIKPIKIIRPDNGREIEIPAYKLADALLDGAKLANE